MKIPAETSLQEFVDRTREVGDFREVITVMAKRIMCLWGPGGRGKSLLLSRMMDECRKQQVRWVHIGWEDSKLYNYLDVMKIIRDQTDKQLFQLFNDRYNFYHVPGYNIRIPIEAGDIQNIQVLTGGEVRQSNVTVHIGHSIYIDASMINSLRPDKAVTDDEVMIECTRAFMPCLQAACERPLVIFFDALEKADIRTLNWIREEILKRVRDRDIINLCIILSGRQVCELDPTFFDCASEYDLKPFQTAEVLEFLERKLKQKSEFLSEFANFILANSNGNPLEIAKFVNNYILYRRQQNTNV